MTNPYCGDKKVPKGRIRGTLEQCYISGQTRYYGIEKIPSSKLQQLEDLKEKHKRETKGPRTKKIIRGRINSLKDKITHLEDRITALEIRIEREKEMDEKIQYNTLKTKLEADLAQNKKLLKSFVTRINKMNEISPEKKKKIPKKQEKKKKVPKKEKKKKEFKSKHPPMSFAAHEEEFLKEYNNK